MTAQLRTALAELADQAKQYADADSAIVGARRRRAGRFSAVAAAVVVLALVLGVAGTRSRAPDVAPGGDGYPATLAPDVEPLRNGALGRAAFLHVRCPKGTHNCDPEIVLSDGRRYAIPGTEQRWPVQYLTLSPDGRFVGWQFPASRSYTLLDLRTGDRRLVGGAENGYWARALQWSADSQRLLIGEYSERGERPRYLMVEPVSGRGRPLPALSTLPAPELVSAVLATGELLIWDQLQQTPLPALRLVDPDTGRETRTLPLGTTDLLRADEIAADPIVDPCGCAVTLVVRNEQRAGARALLKLNLGTIQPTTRTDLPTTGRWTAHAHTPDGLVLTSIDVDGNRVELLNDVTGGRQAVTRLPYGTSIVARGEAMHRD